MPEAGPGVVEAATSGAVAAALLEAGAVSLRLDDPVTFKSGLRSPVYVDNRRLISHPGPWHVVIEAFLARLADGEVAAEVVAGVESAGIPHSSAVAYAARRPSVFVRKAAREHGLRRRVEGGEVAGRRTVLLEDMVTTGGSSLSAVEALRDAGAEVRDCLAIISYGFEGTLTAFEAAGVRLSVLTTFLALIEAAASSGRLETHEAAILREWLADPQAWASR